LVGPVTLAGVLIGLVMTDEAAGTRPDQTMVPDKMSCNATDDRALQATFGGDGTGVQRESRQRGGERRGEQYGFHVKLL